MIASGGGYTSLFISNIDGKRFIALEGKSTQTVRHIRDDAAIVLESGGRILNETQSDQYTTVISLSESAVQEE